MASRYRLQNELHAKFTLTLIPCVSWKVFVNPLSLRGSKTSVDCEMAQFWTSKKWVLIYGMAHFWTSKKRVSNLGMAHFEPVRNECWIREWHTYEPVRNECWIRGWHTFQPERNECWIMGWHIFEPVRKRVLTARMTNFWTSIAGWTLPFNSATVLKI